MNDHDEMFLRAESLARLEGSTCDWAGCDSSAREVVETIETVEAEGHVGLLTRRWLFCIQHAVIARTVPAECAIGDW